MPTGDDILEFQCPKCGKRLKAGSKIAGRRVKCPKCAQEVRVPGMQATKPVAEDQWLELDTPAISDLGDRTHQSKEIQAKKEQERRKQAERKSPLKVSSSARTGAANAPSSASQGSAKKTGAEQTDRDDFRLEPLESAKRPASASGSKPDAGQPKGRIKAAAKTAAKRPASGSAAAPSIFDDELPELAALEETPAKKSAGLDSLLSAQLGEDLVDDLSDPLSSELADVDDAEPDMAEETEDTNPEYRIRCVTCGTAQDVRLAQQGSKMKCPDCYDVFVIPPPRLGDIKSKKKRRPDYESGPDLALTPQDENLQTTEKRERTQAAKILEKAKSDVSEDELDGLYGGDFDTKGFVQRTLGCFRDPIAIAQIVGYGLVFACLFSVCQYAVNNYESDFGKGVLFVAVILVPLTAMLFSLPMLGGGLSLIESVANNERRLGHWPGFDLFDNIGDVLVVLFAMAGALLPGAVVGGVVGRSLALGGHVQITCIMLTTFALFPILLLSMLDNGSLFQPISASVVKSLKEAAEDWGGYFLKTMFGFGIVTLLWYLMIGQSIVMAGFAGFLLPVLFFFVCQQIGALADGIADHLSFEFAVEEGEEDAG